MAKSKYESHVLPKLFLIECWARDGLTDEQIAKKLGISKTTLYKYLSEHFELSELLKKGKEVIDCEVENALLKRAMGYEYEEIQNSIEDDAGKIKKKAVKTKKVLVPDVTAQIFWLKNRRPDKWRDKPVGDDNANGLIENLIKGLQQNE